MVTLAFKPDVWPSQLTNHSASVLRAICDRVGVTAPLIASLDRTPYEQAAAMFANCERTGSEQQFKLYGPMGDKVIAVYVAGKKANDYDSQIKANMLAEIMRVGPQLVSRHCVDPNAPRRLQVIDVSRKSLWRPNVFVAAAKSDPRISHVIDEAYQGCVHLEIPQPV